MVPIYNKKTNLYYERDSDLNNILNNKKNNVRCRFYGIDMNEFAKFKHNYTNDLYLGHTYWRNVKKIFTD